VVFTLINSAQVNESLLKLTRKGVTSSNTIDIIDQLTYNYQSHSNQLSLVGDTADEHGFKDGNTSGNDFEYDLNGNMTIDKNKEIINIEYNHLNLPTKVEFATSNPNAFTAKYISYVYDATGVKQAKYVQEEGLSGVSSIEYSGAFIYERGPDMSPIRLKFISQPEGYIEPVNSSDLSQGFDYVYQFKDHLGNIRLSYSDKNNDGQITASTEIIEENNYYPFGLKHKGYNNVVNGTHYPFGYNGKEENDELGLEWLDFGAQNYDASLGRWMNLDPLAELMRRHSPYNYAFDNPVYWIDPDGRSPEQPDDLGKDSYGNTMTSGAFDAYDFSDKQNNNSKSKKNPKTDWSKVFENQQNELNKLEQKISAQWGSNNETNNVNNVAGSSDNSVKRSGISNLFTKISLGLGVSAEALKTSSSTFRILNSAGSFDAKLYSNGWWGNQWVSTTKISSVGKLVGGLGFGIGLFSDVIGVYIYYNVGPSHINAVSPGKAGVNTSIGLYGLYGGLGGASLSIIYFSLEAFYPGGAVQALEDKANHDKKVSKALGKPFNGANLGTYSPFKQ